MVTHRPDFHSQPPWLVQVSNMPLSHFGPHEEVWHTYTNAGELTAKIMYLQGT